MHFEYLGNYRYAGGCLYLDRGLGYQLVYRAQRPEDIKRAIFNYEFAVEQDDK